MKELDRDIEDIRVGIRAGRFVNEAAVSQGIVQRLLNALGWPVYDTQTVSPEYALEERRVDYALCHPPGKPIAFVEVKRLGQSDGAERQLFEYAFIKGVQLAILTDGQEWNFFLPGEQGEIGERRVYRLDIIERTTEECSHILNRYLAYSTIISGVSIAAAREDYRNVTRERQMRAELPKAWAKLVEEEDEFLLEVLADKVESLCGYKPDPDSVAAFLKNYAAAPLPVATSTPQPRTAVGMTSPPSRTAGVGFVFEGEFHSAHSARDVLIKVFELLGGRDPTFADRFASLPKHGRTRRYLAKRAEDLYPGRPDLVRDHSKQLTFGWWLATNQSRATIRQIIEMACNVAHVVFGKELTVDLGEQAESLPSRNSKPI